MTINDAARIIGLLAIDNVDNKIRLTTEELEAIAILVETVVSMNETCKNCGCHLNEN